LAFITKFLESLDVTKTIQLLYWFDVIDEDLCKQMFKINDERVNLAHAKKGMGYQYQNEEHFRELLDQAIGSVERLMTIRPA